MFQFPAFRGVVKIFVITCFAVFLAQVLALKMAPQPTPGIDALTYFFGLTPQRFLEGHVYTLLSWIFLHSTSMIFHLLFNMLAFWMFGAMIQELLGDRKFLWFCVCGAVFSGLVLILVSFADASMRGAPTIGASGLVFAVVLAFARLYPNQTVIFYIFPMKMKFLAALLVVVDIFFWITGQNQQVSYAAHLAGAAYGFFVIPRMMRGGGHQDSGGGSWLDKFKALWPQRKKKRHLRIIYPENSNERRTYH
jgi:membrane associated rhomboid family serine protease